MTKHEEFTAIFEKGPVVDLHRAKVAMNIFDTISNYANEINNSQYSELFFYIQSFAAKVMALRTCNLFTTPSNRYPQYSLDCLMCFLEANASEIEVANEHHLANLIPNWTDISLTEQNLVLAEMFKAKMPALKDGKADDDREISKDYEQARWYRDKWAAHHEIRQEESKATIGGFLRLHVVAEELLNLFGSVYFATPYIDQQEGYVLDFDAHRPSNALVVMLEELGLISPKKM